MTVDESFDDEFEDDDLAEDASIQEDADDGYVVEDDGVLDTSDSLDDDLVEPLDTGVAAADHWAGANRFGTTAAEEARGESLDMRLAEEEPDIDPYLEPGEDEDEISRRGYETEPRAGRLVAEDEGFGEVDEDLEARDVGIDSGAASAEEAAVHVVDDPDGEGDGPLR